MIFPARLSKLAKSTTLFILSLLISLPGWSDVINVGPPSGANDHLIINTALGAATPGDLLLLADGNYVLGGNIDLSLIDGGSGGDIAFAPQNPGAVTFSGGFGIQDFGVMNGNLYLSGIIFSNVYINVTDVNDMFVTDCQFYSQSAASSTIFYGRAVDNPPATYTISILNNFFDASNSINDIQVDIDADSEYNVLIQGNDIDMANHAGGQGITVNFGAGNLSGGRCTITDNDVINTGSGGGLGIVVGSQVNSEFYIASNNLITLDVGVRSTFSSGTGSLWIKDHIGPGIQDCRVAGMQLWFNGDASPQVNVDNNDIDGNLTSAFMGIDVDISSVSDGSSTVISISNNQINELDNTGSRGISISADAGANAPDSDVYLFGNLINDGTATEGVYLFSTDNFNLEVALEANDIDAFSTAFVAEDGGGTGLLDFHTSTGDLDTYLDDNANTYADPNNDNRGNVVFSGVTVDVAYLPSQPTAFDFSDAQITGNAPGFGQISTDELISAEGIATPLGGKVGIYDGPSGQGQYEPLFSPTASPITGSDESYYVVSNSDGVMDAALISFTVDPPLENALFFDGTDDYVQATIANSDLPDVNQSRTIEFWFKRGLTSGASETMFSYGNYATDQYCAIGFDASNQLQFFGGTLGGTSTITTQTVPVDEWHHVAVKYDGGDIRLLYDGALLTGGTFSVTLNTAFTDVFIGQKVDGTERFEGAIDELAIWDTFRGPMGNPALVISDAQFGITLPDANLVAYYKSNQGDIEGDGSVRDNSLITQWINETENFDYNGDLQNFGLTDTDDFSNFVESAVPTTFSGELAIFTTNDVETYIPDNAAANTTFDTDWGLSTVGVNVDKNYELENIGLSPVTIVNVSDISITGDAEFSLSFNTSGFPNFVLNPGERLNLGVGFNPALDATTYNAQVSVTSDAVTNPYRLNVTGDGSDTPEIDVEFGGQYLTSGNSGSTAHGTEFKVGIDGIVTRTFTIENPSTTQTLTINDISSDNIDFTVVDNTGGSVAPSGSGTFDVTYQAASEYFFGDHNAEVIIDNDDPNEGNFVINFRVETTDNSLQFDGTDDQLTSTYTFSTTGDYTFEFWVNSNFTPGSDDAIFSSSSTSFFFDIQNGSGVARFRNNAISMLGTTSINDGNWHHIALTITYDGSTDSDYVLYVDGNIETDLLDNAFSSAGTLVIGSWNTSNYFEGQLDEFRVWNYARSVDEIRLDAFNSGMGGTDLYYDFNVGEVEGDNSGTGNNITLVPDISGNGFDATIGPGFDRTGTTGNFLETSYAFTDNIPVAFSFDPYIDNISTTGFNLNVTLDEGDALWHYVVVPDGSAAVTSNADIYAGAGDVGGTNTHGFDLPQSTNVINVSGLTDGTPYDIYVYAEDALGNEQVYSFYEVTTVSSGPDITVNFLGNVNDLVNGQGAQLSDDSDFGEAGFHEVITRTVEVTNDGGADLTVTGISNNGSTEFAVSNLSVGLPWTINPGNTETFDVVFTPASVDVSEDGTITITSDDGDENPFDFDVRAIGTDNALYFNDGASSNNEVLIAYNAAFDAMADYTLEGWFYFTEQQNAQLAGRNSFIADGDFALTINSQGAGVSADINDFSGGVYASSPELALNTWYHIAGVKEGTEIRIYVNGVLEDTDVTVVAPVTTTSGFRLGYDNASQHFDGMMDEVRFWSTARSDSEIRQNATSRLTGSESGLIAYYDFDYAIPDGVNTGFTTLLDRTANNNNGTLSGFSLAGGSVSNFTNSDVSSSIAATTPEIVVFQDGNEILDGDNYDFGTVDTGINLDYVFEIINVGLAPLTVNTALNYSGAGYSNQGDPTSPIQPGDFATFTLRLNASAGANPGSLDDLTTNDLDESTFDISFTANGVLDVTPPLLTLAFPLDESNNHLWDDNIELLFDDDMQAGTGSITISGDMGFSEVITLPDPQVTFVSNLVTIDPAGSLVKGENYEVTFGAGVLLDNSGNSFAGLSSGDLNFSTVDIVINEVVTEPQQDWSSTGFLGTPGGTPGTNDEWVELYINSDNVDLTGWTIELLDGTDVIGELDAGSASNAFDVNAFSAGAIGSTVADSYLVLGNVAGGGAINNTGLTINLVDPNTTVVDQVLIGGGGGEAPSGNSTGTSDEAIFRSPNGSDTDASDIDFSKGIATPASLNNFPPAVTRIEAVSTTSIEIEFDENVAFVTDGPTFISNLSPVNVDLTGATAGIATNVVTITLGVALAPDVPSATLAIGDNTIEDLESLALTGHVAQGVTDGIVPSIQSIAANSTTTIEIDFDENISFVTSAASFVSNLLSSNVDLTGPATASILNDVVTITLVGTPLTPDVNPAATLTIGDNEIEDIAGNDVTGHTAQGVSDAIVPGVESIVATSPTTIEIDFDEDVAFVTSPASFISNLLSSNVDLSGPATASVLNDVVTITLLGTPLTPDVTPAATLTIGDNEIEDLAGNDLTGHAAQGVGDGIAPSLLSITIMDTEATPDGFIDQIVFTFDENIDTDDSAPPALADLGTITLPDDVLSDVTTGSVTDPMAATNVVTLSNILSTDYNSENENTAVGLTDLVMGTGLWVDASGNPLPAVTSGSTTVIDGAAPALISSNPADNSLSFNPSANMTLSFSEDITPSLTFGSGNILLNGIVPAIGLIEPFDITADVVIIGNTITIDPTADLTAPNEYALRIPNTAVIDAASNLYAGIGNDDDLDFIANNIAPVECAHVYAVGSEDTDGNLSPSNCNFEPTDVFSTSDTQLEAVSVLYFNLLNGSTGHENVSSITIRNGNTDIDWTAVIAGAELINEFGVSELADNINADNIVFTPDTGNGDLGDLVGNNDEANGMEYALRIWFTTDLLGEAVDIDGKSLIFTVEHGDMNAVDRVLNVGGTAFEANATLEVSSGPITFNVDATEYRFITIGTQERAAPFAATLEATDENGSRDLDFADPETSLTITNTGSSLIGGPIMTSGFATGTASTDPLSFQFEESGITLSTTGGTLSPGGDGTSNSFNVDDTVTPNVVNSDEAYFYDTNADGIIDEVAIQMDEPMSVTSTSADFSLTGTTGSLVLNAVAAPAGNGVDLTDDDEWITFAITGYDQTTDIGTTDLTYTESAGTFVDYSTNNALAAFVDLVEVDAAPPFIVNPTTSDLVPADDDAAAAATSVLQMTFSEDVVAVTGGLVNIYNVNNALVPIQSFDVEDVATVTITNNVVDLALDAVLQKNESYFVLVSAGAFEDLNGNPFAGFLSNTDWNFTLPDTGPIITATFPVHPTLDNSVAPSTDIVLTFDEEVFAPAVSSGTTIITITGDGTFYSTPYVINTVDDVNDEIEDDGLGTTQITINLDIDFDAPETVNVLINEDAFVNGNGTNIDPGSILSIDFSTNVDALAPTVEVYNPTIGATVDEAITQIQIEFNEQVTAGTGNLALYANTNPSTVIGDDYQIGFINVNDAAITFTEKDFADDADATTGDVMTIDITALSPLSGSTEYYLLIGPNAIEDLVGNRYAGITTHNFYNFDTDADEVIAPSVVSLDPADNDDIGVGQTFRLTFDEPVTYNQPVPSGSIRIVYFQNSSNRELYDLSIDVAPNDGIPDVVASGEVTFDGEEVIIDPVSNLSGLVPYAVLITNDAIFDNTGNAFVGISSKNTWNVTTIAEPDASDPPALVSIDAPADDSNNISVSPTIEFTMSEPVEGFPGGSITIQETSPGSATYNIDAEDGAISVFGQNVSIDLSALETPIQLDYNTQYYIEILTGDIADKSGNQTVANIGGSTDWNFQTEIDDEAPVVQILSPTNGASGVATGTTGFQIDFDEDVQPGTGFIRLFYEIGGTDFEVATVDITTAGFSNNQVTFSFDLDAGDTDYYISIDDGAITDINTAAVQSLTGYQDSGTWNFTTATDATVPQFLAGSSLPVLNDIAVDPATTDGIQLKFDEPVVPIAGSLQVYYYADDVLVAQVADLTSGGTSSEADTRYEYALSFVDPNMTFLSGSTQYYVEFTAGSFEDLTGNDEANLTPGDKDQWTFTTDDDMTSPSVTALTPTNVGTAGDADAVVFSMTFDERVELGTGTINVVYDIDPSVTAASFNVTTDLVNNTSGAVSVVTFGPVALSGNLDYNVEIPATAFVDNATDNNAFGGYTGTDWTFDTPDETNAPIISVNTPANAGTPLVGTDLVIDFDEPVVPGTGMIEIRHADDAEANPILIDPNDGAASVADTRYTFETADLSQILSGNTAYYVYVNLDAFLDNSGTPNGNNAFDGTATWAFTTQDDSNNPQIIGLTPSDDAVLVTPGAAQVLSIEFDERVVANTGFIHLFTTFADPDEEVATIDVTSGAVTIDNTQETGSIVNITTDLSGSSSYYIQIDAAAFVDASHANTSSDANNGSLAISDVTSWNFDTQIESGGSIITPTIVSRSPDDNDAGVDIQADLVLTFSEPIFTGSGNITVENSDASRSLVIPAISPNVTGSGTTTITIDIPEDLDANGENHNVYIDGNAFRDASSQLFAGYSTAGDYNFTTQNGVTVVATAAIACISDENAPVAISPDITISESNIGDFPISGSVTIEIGLTDDFIFNTTAAGDGVSVNAGDLSGESLSYPDNQTLEVTYTVGSAAALDVISITGLEILTTSGTPIGTDVPMFRIGGTGFQYGNETYHQQVHLNLQSEITDTPGLTLTNVTVCEGGVGTMGNDATNLSVTAAPDAGHTIHWYQNSDYTNEYDGTGGRTNLVGVASPTFAQLQLDENTPGVQTVYVSQSDNTGGCESNLLPVAVTIYTAPDAEDLAGLDKDDDVDAESDGDNVCSFETIILGKAGNSLLGYDWTWSGTNITAALADDPNPTFEAPQNTDVSFPTNDVENYVYNLDVVDDLGCPSLATASVNVRIDPRIEVGITSVEGLVFSDNDSERKVIQGSGNVAGVTGLFSGTALGNFDYASDPATTEFRPSTAGDGTFPITFTLTDDVTGCTDEASLNIIVNEAVTVFVNGPAPDNCEDVTTVALEMNTAGLAAGQSVYQVLATAAISGFTTDVTSSVITGTAGLGNDTGWNFDPDAAFNYGRRINYTPVSSTFIEGEQIIGGSSAAEAVIVYDNSGVSMIIDDWDGIFTTETITGQTSGATATITTYTPGIDRESDGSIELLLQRQVAEAGPTNFTVLGTQVFTVYPLPEFEITSVPEYVCEDDADILITGEINGVAGKTVLDYRLEKFTGSWVLQGTDPFDNGADDDNLLEIDEVFATYGLGQYRLIASSRTADDPVVSSPGCSIADTVAFEILSKPSEPLLDDAIGTADDGIYDGIGVLSGTTYQFEYCSGATLDDLVAVDTGVEDDGQFFRWYNDAGLSSRITTGLSSVHATVGKDEIMDIETLFGITNPMTTNVILTKTVYLTELNHVGINGSSYEGCESEPTQITLILYPNPGEPSLSNGVAVGANEYIFEYCADGGSSATMTNVDLNGTLDTVQPLETYFTFYADNGAGDPDYGSVLFVSTNTSFDPTLPNGSEGFGFAGNDNTSITVHVTQTYYDNSYDTGNGLDQFEGCESESTSITINVSTSPDAPVIDDFGGTFSDVANLGSATVEYYVCEGDAIEQIETPSETGAIYEWATDNTMGSEVFVDEVGGVDDDIDAFNNRLVTEQELIDHFGYDNTTPGVYTYYVRQYTNANEAAGFLGCPSPWTTIEIEVFVDPASPTFTSHPLELDGVPTDSNIELSFCEEDLASLSIEINGNSGEFHWYEAASDGSLIDEDPVFSSAGGVNVTSHTATGDDLKLLSALQTGGPDSDGNYYFRVSQVNNIDPNGLSAFSSSFFEGCENELADMAFVTIHVWDIPDAPTEDATDGSVTDFYYCFGDAVQSIIAEGEAGVEFSWYDDELLTNEISTSATVSAAQMGLDTSPAVGEYTYYVTQTQDIDGPFVGCESPARAITVHIQGIPDAPTLNDVSSAVCDNNGATAIPTITVQNPANGEETPAVYNWVQDNDNDDDSSAGDTYRFTEDASRNFTPLYGDMIVAADDVSANHYIVSQVTDINIGGSGFAGCESPFTSFDITIHDIPTPPSATGNAGLDTYEYCTDDPTISTLTIQNAADYLGSNVVFNWYSNSGLTDNIVSADDGLTINADDHSSWPGLDRDVDQTITYYVTTTEDGCSSDEFSSANRTAVTFELNPLPDLEMEYDVAAGGNSAGDNLDGTQICYDESVFTIQGIANGVDAVSGTFEIYANETDALTDAADNINTNALALAGFVGNNNDGTATLDPGTFTRAYMLSIDGSLTDDEIREGTPVTFYINFYYTDGEACDDVITYEITVNPQPTLDIEYTETGESLASGLEFCYDDGTIILQAIQENDEASGGSFSISTGGLSDNTNGTATVNLQVAAAAVGETREGATSTHDITYTFTDGNGCSNSVTYTITIHAQPTLDIVFAESAGANILNDPVDGSAVCFDESQFTIKGIQESLDATYGTWTVSTSGLDDDPDLSDAMDETDDGIAHFTSNIAALAGGAANELDMNTTHTITFAYEDGNTCSNTVSATIEVTKLPTLSFIVDTGDDGDNGFCTSTSLVGIEAVDADETISWDTNGFDDSFVISSVATTGLTDNNNGRATFVPAVAHQDPSVNLPLVAQDRDEFKSLHEITLTYTNKTQNAMCTNSISTEILVNPIPELTLFSETLLDINNSEIFTTALSQSDLVEICESEDNFNLIGTRGSNDDGIGTFRVNNVALTSSNSGQRDVASFSPRDRALTVLNSRSQDFVINYEYENVDEGCVNDIERTVRLHVLPEVHPVVDGGCVDPEVLFRVEFLADAFANNPNNTTLTPDRLVSPFADLSELDYHWEFYFADDAGRADTDRPFYDSDDPLNNSFKDGEVVTHTFVIEGDEGNSTQTIFAYTLEATSRVSTLSTGEVGCASDIEFGITEQDLLIQIEPNIALDWVGATQGNTTEFYLNELDLSLNKISGIYIGDSVGVNTYDPIITSEWDPEFEEPPLLEVLTRPNVNNGAPYQVFGPYEHTFNAEGLHQLQIIMRNQNGCYDTLYRDFNVLKLEVVGTDGFVETFDPVDGFDPDGDGWYVEKFKDDAILISSKREGVTPFRESSWSWLPLNLNADNIRGVDIDSVRGSVESDVWGWATLSPNADTTFYTYLEDEDSWLYSPAFDVSGMDQPMVSFSKAFNFRDVSDGVVVQFSIDDGREWAPLGDYLPDDEIASGLNWYNDDNVTRDPGQQQLTFGQNNSLGWSGGSGQDLDPEWTTSKHKLDIFSIWEDQPLGTIRFRFAIASQVEQDPSGFFGFALDDFKILDRNKNVLIEQFYSVSNDGGNFNVRTTGIETQIQDIVSDPSISNGDELFIAYHIDLGVEDPFNRINPDDPGARRAFYSVNGVTSLLDGQSGSVENPSPTELSWTANDFNLSSLRDPGVDIELVDNGSTASEINGILTLTSNKRFEEDEELIVYVAVIEEYVDLSGTPDNINDVEHFNVLRKLLPDASGHFIKFSDSLLINQPIPMDGLTEDGMAASGSDLELEISWDMANIKDASQLAVVAFVQDNNTKEIYQARRYRASDGDQIVLNKNSTDNGTLVTGLDELRNMDFTMYPNPSNDLVTVKFDSRVGEGVEWVLFDQTGRVFAQGSETPGFERFRVETVDFPAGMYYISIKGETHEFKYKKLVIAH